METSASKPTAPQAQYRRNQTFLTQMGRFLGLTVANILFMLISAFVIRQWSPNPKLVKANPRLKLYDHSIPLDWVPVPLLLPSLPIFVCACVFYLSALSSFPNPPNVDPYQIHFLAAGWLMAHFKTTRYGFNGLEGYLLVLKDYLPLYVTIALVASLVSHAGLRRGYTRRAAPREKVAEKTA